MSFPAVGDRVKYLGSLVVPDGPWIEEPSRIGREGVIVPLFDGNGNDIETSEGSWPVNVKWDNGDSTQSVFEGEIEQIDG
jgi:hypothetical protein